jgi:hypothetical protein
VAYARVALYSILVDASTDFDSRVTDPPSRRPRGMDQAPVVQLRAAVEGAAAASRRAAMRGTTDSVVAAAAALDGVHRLLDGASVQIASVTLRPRVPQDDVPALLSTQTAAAAAARPGGGNVGGGGAGMASSAELAAAEATVRVLERVTRAYDEQAAALLARLG